MIFLDLLILNLIYNPWKIGHSFDSFSYPKAIISHSGSILDELKLGNNITPYKMHFFSNK